MAERKPIVIILNGYPLSGKDTFCEFAETEYETINYSTVDTVKDIATWMGWDGEKTPANRAMLSDLKDFFVKWFDGTFKEMTELITNECEDVWKAEKEDYKVDFIFLHIREPEEISRMYIWCTQNDVKCYRVCINRKLVVEEEEYTNHADKNVNGTIYDAYLGNGGSLDEFKSLTLEFLRDIVVGKMDEYLSYE